MLKPDLDLLTNYAEELGVTISIATLIDSHRVLRQAAMRSRSEQQADLDRARAAAVSSAHDDTWVRWEYLSSMSLASIAAKCCPET